MSQQQQLEQQRLASQQALAQQRAADAQSMANQQRRKELRDQILGVLLKKVGTQRTY